MAKMYRIRNQSKNPWTLPVPKQTERTEERRRLIRTSDGEEEIIDEQITYIETRAAEQRIVVPPTYSMSSPGYSDPFDKTTLGALESCPKFKSLIEGNKQWLVVEPYDGA